MCVCGCVCVCVGGGQEMSGSFHAKIQATTSSYDSRGCRWFGGLGFSGLGFRGFGFRV